ncbi:hypothetical protein D3C84_1131830 [compost metagenome]
MPGKARAVKWPLPFQKWLLPGDFFAVVAGNGLDDRLSLCWLDLANLAHWLTKAFDPQLAVAIAHQFNSLRIIKCVND